MVRAAAKTHAWAGVVTDPARYDAILEELRNDGGRLSAATRADLALEAFAHTAGYDAAIVHWLDADSLPRHLILPLEKVASLRYGENPHQAGARYRDRLGGGRARREVRERGQEAAVINPPHLGGGLAGGGFLVQEPDPPDEDRSTWKVVTKVAPTDEQLDDMAFAMKVCAAAGSNAIVLAKGGVAYGIGAGQQSRVHSAEMAAKKADGRARGGVCASDAFFPFRDGVDTAVAAGAAAIVPPGGSLSDDKGIAAARETGGALGVTRPRHLPPLPRGSPPEPP